MFDLETMLLSFLACDIICAAFPDVYLRQLNQNFQL